MTVYNITVKINPAIEEEWIAWQKQVYIPAMMRTEQFSGYTFYRLLEQDEQDGITYVFQYTLPGLQHYQQFTEKFARDLQQIAWEKWGDQFVSFQTIMEAVQ